ncbi:hypothetical protein T01_11961 [Trichinella spiralis]|uniref:Uncharacterized protein n=1 Tax=Trichinella spiralis TaxID=6334 RepID=A0A0V1B5F5_TRISP|nr:hypothetical protein T01_11961 [Trichinella spiralis]
MQAVKFCHRVFALATINMHNFYFILKLFLNNFKRYFKNEDSNLIFNHNLLLRFFPGIEIVDNRRCLPLQIHDHLNQSCNNKLLYYKELQLTRSSAAYKIKHHDSCMDFIDQGWFQTEICFILTCAFSPKQMYQRNFTTYSRFDRLHCEADGRADLTKKT